MNFIGYRTLKTAISASLSIVIASFLNLLYPTSAGVISILSMQNTKRQSFEKAITRILSCLVALALASFIFINLGFTAWGFGIFLLFFIPISVKLKLEEGIIVNSVLATHLLVAQKITLKLLTNELMLIIVGAGVALLFNLYMPNLEVLLKEDQKAIEDRIKKILMMMSESLKNQDISLEQDEDFESLEIRLKSARNRAYQNLNNSLWYDASYYLRYMQMRIMQLDALKRMKNHFSRFFMNYQQSNMISEFTMQVAYKLHEDNRAKDELEQLEELRDTFKNMDLPKTREEFENRALLFQFLNDMEDFLKIKNDFLESSSK